MCKKNSMRKRKADENAWWVMFFGFALPAGIALAMLVGVALLRI